MEFIITFKYGKDIGEQETIKVTADSKEEADDVTTFLTGDEIIYQCVTSQIESIN